MLKLILYLIISSASIVLLFYGIQNNKPKINGRILISICMYLEPLKKKLLIIYPIIFNHSNGDNTIVGYKIQLDCGMGFFQIPTYFGMEDEKDFNCLMIPGPFFQNMLLIKIKEKILEKDLTYFSPGNYKHGYLFAALDPNFFFKNILRIKLIISDVFGNEYEIIEETKNMTDVPLFQQYSEAKIYKRGEERIMTEMINKYCGNN
jgi:hypothetical protein